MAFLTGVNLDNVPDREYDNKPIPEGWYQAEIKKAELKPTKDGSGTILNIQYSILGPTNAGRVVFDGLNIKNKNPKTEEYALQDLKAIRNAIGLASLQDTDQLIGGRLEIKVKVEESPGYEPRNVVKGYKALNGGTMPKPQAPAQPVPSKPATNQPPWAKTAQTTSQPEIY